MLLKILLISAPFLFGWLWYFSLHIAIKKKARLLEAEFDHNKNFKATSNDIQLIIDHIHDCVFAMNEHGVFTYISDNVFRITGYTADEIIGKENAPFFTPNRINGNGESLNNNQEIFINANNKEIEITHKNGAKRWVRASVNFNEDFEKGKSINGTFHDISTEMNLKQEMGNFEKRFKQLMENSPIAIFIFDGENYKYVNRKFAKMLGGKPEDFIGKKLDLSFLLKSEISRMQENLKLLLSGEKDQSDNVYKVHISDRKPIYIHLFTSVIEENKIKALYGTAIDITDEVNAQHLLKEQEEQFRIITEKSFTGLVLTQRKKVIYINPRFLEIIGREGRQYTLLEEMFKLVHPDDLDKVKESIQDRRDGIIDHAHYQCRMFHKNGHIIYLDIFGSNVTINGQSAIMSSFMDITESVKFQKKLQDSITEKNILLAEIHHRVKNNMAVVSGLIELQKFKTDDEVAQGLLNESQRRIKTIAMIHEKLYQSSSFSEIPFGNYLSGLLKNVSSSLYSDRTDISIEEKYDDVLLNINQAIPAALLANEIITNSFKHAFKNKEKGIISVGLTNRGNNKLTLCFSDNGIGLPDDYEKKDSLGITLIKSLTKQLEADLEISNNNGSKFEITFTSKNVTKDLPRTY